MDINVKGKICGNNSKWVYDLLKIEATCPNDVTSALASANGESVDVYINSGGGEVFAGSEIYSALRAYRGPIAIHVVGLAASAASVIMCAAHSDIAPTAMVMIHNVSGCASGNYLDMAQASEQLRTASQAICAAYVEKTGKPAEDLQQMMDAERWFTAQEAVALGLCDEITGGGLQMVAAATTPVIPDVVAVRLADIMAKEKQKWKMLGAAEARLAVLEGKE